MILNGKIKNKMFLRATQLSSHLVVVRCRTVCQELKETIISTQEFPSLSINEKRGKTVVWFIMARGSLIKNKGRKFSMESMDLW